MTVVDGYELWTNYERTILFRLWGNGEGEVAQRPTAHHVWGPPIRMTPEGVDVPVEPASPCPVSPEDFGPPSDGTEKEAF